MGAAGVTAQPLAKIYSLYGKSYMAASLFLASIFEVLFGLAKLSHISNIVVEPIIAGFLNALAIFIAKSQVMLEISLVFITNVKIFTNV